MFLHFVLIHWCHECLPGLCLIAILWYMNALFLISKRNVLKESCYSLIPKYVCEFDLMSFCLLSFKFCFLEGGLKWKGGGKKKTRTKQTWLPTFQYALNVILWFTDHMRKRFIHRDLDRLEKWDPVNLMRFNTICLQNTAVKTRLLRHG